MHPRSPIPTRSKTTTRMAGSTPKFALTPGRANTNVLDLASKLGIAAFHSGSAPLTVPFDGNSKDISMLQSQINRRVNNSGWNYMTGDILTIENTKRENKDLITEYGCLSEQEIKNSLVYLNTESRQARQKPKRARERTKEDPIQEIRIKRIRKRRNLKIMTTYGYGRRLLLRIISLL